MENVYLHGRVSVAADASARVYFAPPTSTGKWRIKSLTVTPNVTSANNGTNYVSLELKVGSTAAATARTTAATDLTQGTSEALTLSGDLSTRETTQAAPMYFLVDAATNGTGVATDVAYMAVFEQLLG